MTDRTKNGTAGLGTYLLRVLGEASTPLTAKAMLSRVDRIAVGNDYTGADLRRAISELRARGHKIVTGEGRPATYRMEAGD